MADWRSSIDDMYSDDEAREILRRAAELDKNAQVSSTDLRDIASEANISRKAIEQALAETALDKRMQKTDAMLAREDEREADMNPLMRRMNPRQLFWAAAIGMLVAAFFMR